MQQVKQDGWGRRRHKRSRNFCRLLGRDAHKSFRKNSDSPNSFATHFLEQKVDIRIIQVLLGHKKLETTALYAQVATDILREVVSPIETLQPL